MSSQCVSWQMSKSGEALASRTPKVSLCAGDRCDASRGGGGYAAASESRASPTYLHTYFGTLLTSVYAARYRAIHSITTRLAIIHH